MVWCNHCAKNINSHLADGKICCYLCGRVLDEDNFSMEPTFVKNAGGQSTMSGTYVKSFQNEESGSRVRTLEEALAGINQMICDLLVDGGDSTANAAWRLYTIALDRNFTRGRRKELVQASCLYIVCREGKKPFLLIDFSEYLRVNVYVLGAVFLQLCKLLSLEEHPIVQKPVDPSLFIHRFTERVLKSSKSYVSENTPQLVVRTALLIVASMKRDWMQTGRKPSGLCGAAIYISALSYGFTFLKSEITKVVHICEATLTKRLIEFENTESGSLTIDEFTTKAKQLEKEEMFTQPGSKASGISELLCQHKGSGMPHFAHGLCESCYKDFIELSGGLDGIGRSEPPAFQRAEMERIMAKEAAALKVNEPLPLNSDKQGSIKNVNDYEDSQPRESDLTGAKLRQKLTHDSDNDIDQIDDTNDESETLSDIDDTEVDVYLHNKEETERKKIVWEEMNKEYLEEEAAKEAAAEAAKKAYEAHISNCSEEQKKALKLAAEAAASIAKLKKEKQQKRAADMKNIGPAQTAVEATKQMLDKKRLSNKINFDVLKELFDESEIPEITKKHKTDPKSDEDATPLNLNKEDSEIETMEDAYSDDVEEHIDVEYSIF